VIFDSHVPQLRFHSKENLAIKLAEKSSETRKFKYQHHDIRFKCTSTIRFSQSLNSKLEHTRFICKSNYGLEQIVELLFFYYVEESCSSINHTIWLYTTSSSNSWLPNMQCFCSYLCDWSRNSFVGCKCISKVQSIFC
jgi:hypothetical protein